MATFQSLMKSSSSESLTEMVDLPDVELNGGADHAPHSDGCQEMTEEDTSIPTTTTQIGLGEEQEDVTNQKPVKVFRKDLKVTDVVLGRSNEKGIYPTTLKDWWERYESASHSGKRIICRTVIRELHQKGVRFLNKVDDDTRHGYYTVVPHTSVTVERKVLRALREQVRLHEADGTFTSPDRHTVYARVKETKSRSKSDGKKAAEKKTPPAKRSKVTKFPPPVHHVFEPPADEPPQRLGDVPYIPILPATGGEHAYFPLIFLPPLLRKEATPPTLQVAKSSGSVGGDQSSSPQLIPSALNWSTSDLKAAQVPTSKPQAATSPDTVMLPLEDTTTMPGPSKPILQVRSSISYDLTKIFDDVIDPVTGDITTTNNPNKECPPLLSGRQSSMFSMVNFTDWQHEMGQEGHPLKNVLKPSTSTMHRRMSLIDDDVSPHDTTASYIGLSPSDDPMLLSTPRRNDHFDRSSFFGEDETTAFISPNLAPPQHFGKPKSPTVDLTLPRITPPDEERYHRRSPSLDSMEDRSNLHHPIPMQQATSHRAMSDQDNEEYRVLCRRLEVSMARLESEELEHRSWEAHNEALWRHFIQEQPDLAKLLNTRSREDTKVPGAGAPSRQKPVGRPKREVGNPDRSAREDFHNIESWKWLTHSFGDETEDCWAAV